MATVTNQYGTFETDKQIGGKRLPSNPQLESIAQKLYGKSFDDLTIEQRTKIRIISNRTEHSFSTVCCNGGVQFLKYPSPAEYAQGSSQRFMSSKSPS